MNSLDFNVIDFWQRVKTFCKEKKITQKELSLKIGYDNRFIESQIFKKIVPNIEEVVKIANIFDVSLNYLILGKEVKNSQTENLLYDLSELIKKYE